MVKRVPSNSETACEQQSCLQGRDDTIDIESLQNRLLKVCYVPATSASLPRVSFFFSFFVAAAIDSTNEANKVPLSSLYS